MRTLFPAAALLAMMAVGCQNTTKDTAAGGGNQAPIANAGPDIQQAAAAAVELDGSASFDPDGDPITYHWSLEHVPESSSLDSMKAPFTLNYTEGAALTSFVPDMVGTYVVKLVVKDATRASAPDYMVVVAEQPDDSPVANAGNDHTVAVGTPVTLDGSLSYDPSGLALSYSWTVVDRPDGSSSDIASSTSPATSITPDTRGVYVVSLLVDNGVLQSAPDATVITATGENGAPTANAGVDFEAGDCTWFELDGSGSVDPEGDPLTYYWNLQLKPDDSTVTNDSFDDRAAEKPKFWADIAGTYIFSLTVSDGENWATPDVVTADVGEREHNSAPLVDAGMNLNLDAGEATCEVEGYGYACEECADMTVELGADASVSDVDGDPFTMSWAVVDGDATISDPTSVVTNATLSGAEPEEPSACTTTYYTFELSATDCPGSTTADTVTVALSCCGVE